MTGLPLNYQRKLTNIKFIDLFAGIGGLRTPFEKLGGKCVFSCEIDPNCQKTYQTNFGEIPFGDIRLLDISKLPKFDLLLAGFPCQPFSIAGHKKGLADERGNLFFEIVKILEHHQPKVFLLENVKGLTHKNNQEILETMLDKLENCGYQVSHQVLNAKNFGLPQNRERIYIVGNKIGEKFAFPNPNEKKTKLGDILEKKVSSKYTITPKI
jgi:DNA (cytosine-5)-methyltransferase 1